MWSLSQMLALMVTFGILINWHQFTVLSEVKRFIKQYNVNFSIKFAEIEAQGKRRALRNGSCLEGQISLEDYCVYNYSSKFLDNTQDLLDTVVCLGECKTWEFSLSVAIVQSHDAFRPMVCVQKQLMCYTTYTDIIYEKWVCLWLYITCHNSLFGFTYSGMHCRWLSLDLWGFQLVAEKETHPANLL